MGEEQRKPGEASPEPDPDAAERRRYRQALRESEERFKRLAEACYEGVAILEGDRVVDANPQAAAMLGYELSEYIGMSMFADVVAAREPRDRGRDTNSPKTSAPGRGTRFTRTARGSSSRCARASFARGLAAFAWRSFATWASSAPWRSACARPR